MYKAMFTDGITDDDLLVEIKEEFGVDMPKEFL